MREKSSKVRISDKQEEAIVEEIDRKRRDARLEFTSNTKEAWGKYESIWKPAREKWEEFSRPYFERLKNSLVEIDKEKEESLGKVRNNWGKCPRCNIFYARFQAFCTNEKCGLSLIAERRINEGRNNISNKSS